MSAANRPTDSEIREQELVRANAELMRRDQVMQSLLEDLQRAKEERDKQAEELRSANRQLKEIAGRKDDLVAKTSHELRTPLTSIKEGLSLLLDRALGEITESQKDFLQTMDSDVDRLAELINNMLDLSKIEAGRMRLNREAMDVRKVIESLIQSYRTLAGDRTIEVVGNGFPEIFGDAHRLRQVFSNLFSNAMKITKNDGRIIFRIRQEENMIAVSVEDNGPGIAAEELERLFQKFMQVGGEAGGRRGTGLGLVVCKELTELHGGRIKVESELGQGTTFTVFLPVFSETFAFTESFWELLGTASGDDRHISMVVVDAGKEIAMEQMVEQVRDRVHRGDIVLSQDGRYILILGMTDAVGCEAIIQRLRTALPGGEATRFGWGVYPGDGRSAQEVYKHALARLEAGEVFTKPKKSHTPNSITKEAS